MRLHRTGALLIVVTDPIRTRPVPAARHLRRRCGCCRRPSLGIPPSFGGPHLASSRRAWRRCGASPVISSARPSTADGRPGYVLTLATREQHIRRAKATSNICTNSALCALAAATYLATMGKHGVRQFAELCFHKAITPRPRSASSRVFGQPAGSSAALFQRIRGAAAGSRRRDQRALAHAIRNHRRLRPRPRLSSPEE